MFYENHIFVKEGDSIGLTKKRRKLYQKLTACSLSAMMLFSGVLPNRVTLSAQAASEPAEQYNITENGDMTYIATMKNDASYDRVTAKAESMDALAEEQPAQLEQNNVAVLELDKNDVNQIEQMNGVVTLEEDIILTANEEVPIDETKVESLIDEEAELPFRQWNLDAVNLPDDAGLTGDNVKVAVLDSGVTAAEDVLITDSVDLTNSGNENPFFNDATGHGTSIAALIGANGIGDMEGIAPDAEIYDIRVLDGNNTAPLSKIIEGIYWCIENDMDIINMSFGTTAYSPSLEQAISDAQKAGIIVIAAAGNKGAETASIDYPAAFNNVIAVGASNGDNALTDFTSQGDGIDVLAPGEKIWSYGAFAGLQALDGTSIATAHVTGAVALLLERYPDADTEFIRQLLMASSNQESGDSGLGILNIGESISMADGFQVQESNAKIEPQAPTATTYDTDEIVSGSWGGSDHRNMVSVLGSTNVITIAANAAQKVDDLYHAEGSKIECRALHARYNYAANLNFLYIAAQGATGKQLDNKESIQKYVNSVNVTYTNAAEKGDIDNLKRVLIHACNANGGLSKKVGASSTTQKKYVILGMAAHLIGDTFAHRTMVPKGASGGSSRDSKTFVKAHFGNNWSGFKDRYEKLFIEFRDIKNYLPNPNNNVYTDRSDFFPNRFTASKNGVAKLVKRYEGGKAFSATAFYNLEEGGFSKNLNNLNGYLKSAGLGTVSSITVTN